MKDGDGTRFWYKSDEDLSSHFLSKKRKLTVYNLLAENDFKEICPDFDTE